MWLSESPETPYNVSGRRVQMENNLHMFTQRDKKRVIREVENKDVERAKKIMFPE